MSDVRTKVDALKDLGEKITGKTITIDENETVVSILDKITENYDGEDTPGGDTPEEETITLNFPATLPVGIISSDPNEGETGTVEFAPYLDSSYRTTVDEIAQGIEAGTLTEVIINQDENTWTFDNLSFRDSIISLLNDSEGIGTSLQIQNNDTSHIWVDDTDIQFAKATAPDSNVDNHVVFAEAIANTNFENILNNVTDGSLLFLTQEGLTNGYVCTYGASVSPNDTARLLFEYGDETEPETYGKMTVELYWYNEEGEEAGEWDFSSASVSSGFENINTNV